MKRNQSLGRSLTRDEQKRINGGDQIVCVCDGGQNHMHGQICHYTTPEGFASCYQQVAQYCGGVQHMICGPQEPQG